MSALLKTEVRPAAVSGRFYPRAPEELRGIIRGFLAQAPPVEGPAPKALVAPHAGYIFSGPIAARAYAALAPARATIRRVVLLGPAHYAEFPGVATVSCSAFQTPLGHVPVDTATLASLQGRGDESPRGDNSFLGARTAPPRVIISDEAHAPEHCLEVQLPFLQSVLDEFQIVPLLASHVLDSELELLIGALWGGPDTLIVISSDLSHYHSLQSARALDTATADAIAALAPEHLSSAQACGAQPIRGLLRVARSYRLRASTLDLRTSGDTGGPSDRVVGYGAFAFFEQS